MGSVNNRLRKKWQDYSGLNAADAEHSFFDVFTEIFKGTEYIIESQPQYFNDIYVDVPLSDEEISQIYTPSVTIKRHGVKPDSIIKNTRTGKSIIIELKRQDGWVENKPRSAGRGNAHERLCKYFTPGLVNKFREFCNLTPDVYPFCVVFQGDITRDPCRVREITFWFGENTANFFFWRNTADPTPLIAHFEQNILPLLE